jgi:hypothetical protein
MEGWRGQRYLHAINDLSILVHKLDGHDRRLANNRMDAGFKSFQTSSEIPADHAVAALSS